MLPQFNYQKLLRFKESSKKTINFFKRMRQEILPACSIEIISFVRFLSKYTLNFNFSYNKFDTN